MHERIWAADASIRTEDGKGWLLRYYVDKMAAESRLHADRPPVYGLTVEKYADDGLCAETRTAPAFTGQRAEAEALALRFARGSVTPSVLLEMVDEWI